MAKKEILGMTRRFFSGLIIIAVAFTILYLRPFQSCPHFWQGIPIISGLICTTAGVATTGIFSIIFYILLAIGIWRVITK